MKLDQLPLAIQLINQSSRILLVSHRRPDGDTLGASSGLYLGLKQLGKNATVACIDEIPKRLRFIPETDKYIRQFNMSDYDLIIISDAGASHMTGFQELYPEFLSKNVPILNIDHHASNDNFGNVNIVDATASSATMLTWALLKAMHVTFTKEIALALLAGIYNDTGGLMHSNTTKETFEISAELCAMGVKVTDIVRPMFKESTMSQLKLWGHILEATRKNDKDVLSSVVTEGDLKVIGAHSSDTGGIIDLMNTIPDAAYSLLLAEDAGWVKGSLRTQREDVNVSDIASQFGGGGHRKAAGFRIAGKLQKEVTWKIVGAGSSK